MAYVVGLSGVLKRTMVSNLCQWPCLTVGIQQIPAAIVAVVRK